MFIKENAEYFLNAFHVIRESNSALVHKLSGSPINISGVKVFGALPAMGVEVVCLAFSVELYLKSLHYLVTRKRLRGHNILKLFKKLPEGIQQQIFQHPSVTKYGWSFSQFEREIELVSDGFEKWRYSHETTMVKYNSYFALVFIEAVRDVSTSEIS
jgi:hypothetical protein